MKYLIVLLVVAIFTLCSLNLLSQEGKVDAGIFSGLTPDTLILKARPDFLIQGQSVTNAQLTIKWSESSPITELQWLFTSVGLFPQGPTIISEGYRYQVYGSFGGSNLNWTAGQEYTILKLKTNSQTGSCTEFEIAMDDWTQANNGDYYFEILGEDHTGIRYVPSVNFGSEGGYVNGDTTIYLGNSTGAMSLMEFSGNVLHWERKINQGTWDILPETEGLISYEDTPTLQGIWEYRGKVEKPGCTPHYSDPAVITVELLAVWTGAVNTVWDNPGNWNVVGIPDLFQDGRVPVTGNGFYPDIYSDALCKNLLIDENASVTIYPQGTLTLSGYLQNDGAFSMLSDTLSSSSLLENGISGEGTFTSNSIVKPSLFQLFSTPVTGALSEAFTGMYAYRWDEPASQWIAITDPDDSLGVGKGYLVETGPEGGNDITFAGTGFSTGMIVSDLTNNGNANGHAGGFNLAGNPYPSAINWNDEVNFILDRVDPAIYILDGESGNYGTYIRHDEGSSTLGIDSIIGIHQGFMVHVSHNASSGNISINNNARLHNNQVVRQFPPIRSAEPYLKLQVNTSGNSLKDEAVIRFIQEATTAFDSQFDAYDLAGFSDSPQLFSRCPDTSRMSVNTYPPLTSNTIIPLGFEAGFEDNFTITVSELLNLGPDTLVILEDLKMDTIYPLTQDFSLDFSASPSDDPDRFSVHFRVEPVNIPAYITNSDLKLFVSGKVLHIYCSDENFKGTLELVDPAGRFILKKEISGLYNTVNTACRPGLYIVRIFGGKAVHHSKVIIG